MATTTRDEYYLVYPTDGIAFRRNTVEAALAVSARRVERITEVTTRTVDLVSDAELVSA